MLETKTETFNILVWKISKRKTALKITP